MRPFQLWTSLFVRTLFHILGRFCNQIKMGTDPPPPPRRAAQRAPFSPAAFFEDIQRDIRRASSIRDDLRPYTHGASNWRVMASVFMQAVILSVVVHKMQQGGLFDAVGTWAGTLNPLSKPCGLLPHKEFILLSDCVVKSHGTVPGLVHVRGGRIAGVVVGGAGADRHRVSAAFLRHHSNVHVIDYGSAVVGPGLIDVHVHMNEPGRVEWEGMATATRAAAAGGVTTVVDMPLNSFPCTTTPAELRRKAKAAAEPNKTYVDLGFWAGLVPENAHKPAALKALAAAGALGFKAFMSPSGIDDFPHCSPADVAAALPTLRTLGLPLLAHAELVDEDVPHGAAVTALIDALRALPPLPSPAPPAALGFGVHVVHISDAGALRLLRDARSSGLPLTAETCPHYLNFDTDSVAEGDTRFKCAPPIRDPSNRAALWESVASREFDGLSSDHSPAPQALKHLESGDFTAAWGGIAGLQYSLPATWHGMGQRGLTPGALHQMWSRFPAALAGLSRRKGSLATSMDADIVVWAPEQDADTAEAALQHKHKATPYAGAQLKGRVLATFVRGSQVFDARRGLAVEACGSAGLRRGDPPPCQVNC